jgi:hypothetical protein
MSVLALAAPVTAMGASPGAGAIAGLVLPASEAGTLTGNTGLTVPNNGAVLVRIVIGSAGTGTAQFVCQKLIDGAVLPVTTFTQVLANSTAYIFGPFKPSEWNDVNGLLNINLPSATGNSAGAYLIPGSLSGS